MKKLVLLLFFFLLFFFPRLVSAQNPDYVVESFSSEITIEQDTSLTVAETIKVNFLTQKHGIYRIIPKIYSSKGKTIDSKFNLVSITDDLGNSYDYDESNLRQSVKLKIGDPVSTISGIHYYVIKYKVDNVLLAYDGIPELYWNVTGSEWDTQILTSTAVVTSNYADIEKTACYAGEVGTKEENCNVRGDGKEAVFILDKPIGYGEDFTIVVGLSSDNQLIFPGFIEKASNFIFANWGYIFSIIPIGIVGLFWFKKGRDKRYLLDTTYYKPDDKASKTVSVFSRPHIPMVYSAIDGMTPAEVGTVVDERINIHDIISEIIELARLGYIKVVKIEKKGRFSKPDYAFVNLVNKASKEKKLKEHQKLILKEITKASYVTKGSKELEKLISKKDLKSMKIISQIGDNEFVLLSNLKNSFYKILPDIKKALYKNMKGEVFVGNPENTRIIWVIIFIVLTFVSLFASFVFVGMTYNFGPVVLTALFIVPGILLAISMPRRTAWGYSLYRQALGLREYLNIGKWRHEVNEKHLFLEEVLPLAISLGVIGKLAKDMAVLGIAPPSYFAGTSAVYLGRDLASFSKSALSTLMSTPSPSRHSGRSSWSGGSGFSGGGGSSGGGFGGGGGGSW